MASAFTHRPDNAGAVSLRASVVGGTVSAAAVPSPKDLFERPGRFILMIHGFNVTQAQADESYDAFQKSLGAENRAQIVRLYWPGDTSTRADSERGRQGRITKIISPLAYMFKPKRALQSSKKLRTLLKGVFQARAKARVNQPLELCIVAHSLGCRLTLEALDDLTVGEGSIVAFPLVVLMAAAVPQYSVVDDGNFVELIDGMPKLWVLHSRRDRVLSRYFRPGQLFERAAFPDFRLSVRGAIGRRGMASSDKVRVLEGIWDHSDYWPDRDIAEAVDRELGGKSPEGYVFESLSRQVWERSVQERTALRRSMAEATQRFDDAEAGRKRSRFV